MHKRRSLAKAGAILAAFGLLAFLLSCGAGNKTVSAPTAGQGAAGSDAKKKVSARGHKSGAHTHDAPHGGTIKEVGDYHLEMTYDKKNGEVSLYILDEDSATAYPVEAQAFPLRVKLDGETGMLDVNMNPIPGESDPTGKVSHFSGTHSELMNAKAFEVRGRVPIDGQWHLTTFLIDPSQGKAVYACPMNCEKDKVYYQPGICAVCKMDLAPPGKAHCVHSPQKGGIFYMAPNNWHHLEGVMHTASEFRLFFYNNYTKPISAKRFLEGSYLNFVNLDSQKREVGKPVQGKFSLAADEEFLTAPLPEGIRLPYAIIAHVKFEGRERPEVFTFSFPIETLPSDAKK